MQPQIPDHTVHLPFQHIGRFLVRPNRVDPPLGQGLVKTPVPERSAVLTHPAGPDHLLPLGHVRRLLAEVPVGQLGRVRAAVVGFVSDQFLQECRLLRLLESRQDAAGTIERIVMVALDADMRPPVGNGQIVELVLLQHIADLVGVRVGRSVSLLDSDNPGVRRSRQLGRLVHVRSDHQAAKGVAVACRGRQSHQVSRRFSGRLGRTVVRRSRQPRHRQRVLLGKPLGQHPVCGR